MSNMTAAALKRAYGMKVTLDEYAKQYIIEVLHPGVVQDYRENKTLPEDERKSLKRHAYMQRCPQPHLQRIFRAMRARYKVPRENVELEGVELASW